MSTNIISSILVILLISIIVIMIYNFVIIYNSSSYKSENFQQESTVNNIINRISSYSNNMHNELKSYYDKQGDNDSAKPQNLQIQTKNQLNVSKNDLPEEGITKLVIYHMNGCGHCHAIMDKKRDGSKSTFDELIDMFKNDTSVKIYDFKLGRDKEAEKFQAFPVIKIITSNGNSDYNGPRDATNMNKAILSKK